MSVATPTQENTPAISSFVATIDTEQVKKAMADNWGWIMAAGILGVVGGTVALMAPVLATGITATLIAITLAVVGIVNMAGVCFAEKGMKLESFLTGAVQMLLAGVIAFYPFASLMSMTILIAAFILADGVMRAVLAIQNRDLPGWGWTLAGGIVGILAALIVMMALPLSALWVIGILVGVNLLTSGVARIVVANEARKIAKAA